MLFKLDTFPGHAQPADLSRSERNASVVLSVKLPLSLLFSTDEICIHRQFCLRVRRKDQSSRLEAKWTMEGSSRFDGAMAKKFESVVGEPPSVEFELSRGLGHPRMEAGKDGGWRKSEEACPARRSLPHHFPRERQGGRCQNCGHGGWWGKGGWPTRVRPGEAEVKEPESRAASGQNASPASGAGCRHPGRPRFLVQCAESATSPRTLLPAPTALRLVDG